MRGRKPPGLDTAARLLREAGFELTTSPRVDYVEWSTARGRSIWVPSRLGRLPVTRALASVVLPLHLNWSEPRRTFRLADRAQRARAYEIVSARRRPGRPRRLRRWSAAGRPVARASSAARDSRGLDATDRGGHRLGRGLVTDDGPGDGQRTYGETALTASQLEVARIFFSLPASAGFLLAGGLPGSPAPDGAAHPGPRFPGPKALDPRRPRE